MTDIEWGQWQTGLPSTPNDIQGRRINNKWQYRVRKAPPAPVVETVTCLGFVAKRYGSVEFGLWHSARRGDRIDGPQFALTFQTRDGAVDTSVAPSVEWVK